MFIALNSVVFALFFYLKRFSVLVNNRRSSLEAKLHSHTGLLFCVAHKIYKLSCADPIKINKEIKIKVHVN